MKAEETKSVIQQLYRLAHRLEADVKPGHVEYISKRDAASACFQIARQIEKALEALNAARKLGTLAQTLTYAETSALLDRAIEEAEALA